MTAQNKLIDIAYVEIKESEKRTKHSYFKSLIYFNRYPPMGCLGKESELFEQLFSKVLVLSLIILNLFFTDGFKPYNSNL